MNDLKVSMAEVKTNALSLVISPYNNFIFAGFLHARHMRFELKQREVYRIHFHIE
jgi:hypothetical protein